jgi:hypothetical protein
MTNQPSLRSIVRVQVSPRKAELSIPVIRGRSILARQSRLCSRARSLRRRIGITDIDQLVSDLLCDDCGVKSFFLALVD